MTTTVSPGHKRRSLRAPDAQGEPGGVPTDPASTDLASTVSVTESETALARVVHHTGTAEGAQPIRVGRYSVLEEIGRGGMGVVYRAEQSEPVRRQVALKLLLSHRGSRHAERFREECQTIARMRHPNIAQMLDAGETEEGHPFLVLEYIDGEPLTDFCDQKALDVRERLDLFIKVCEGIQHAHQKGVVHRDLKPSNILVTQQGSQVVPKVIDFGIAKLLDASRDLTKAGQLIGSPSHMSPEQLQGGGADVDTRADVYALGNVLFELLTGTMVFIAASGSFYDYMLQITRNDPQKPSGRCHELETNLESIAAKRKTSASGLVQQLRGDLDAIVLKALARNREERYPSASGLALDLRRHLDGLPVIAHPGGRRYQLRKLIGRHKAAVVAATLVILALGIATISTSISLRRARAAERQERIAATHTQAVNRILEDILSSPDPAVDGKDVTLLSVLDRTADRVTDGLAEQPETASALLHVLGRTYTALGVYPKAEKFLADALSAREAHLGAGANETLATREAMTRYHLAAGVLPPAAELARQQLEITAATHGEHSEQTLRAQCLLGQVLYALGQYDEAEGALRVAFDGLAGQLGRDHLDVLTAHLALGKTLRRVGQTDAAETIFRSVHDARASKLGTDHPSTIESANLLGNVLYTTRRFDQAEAQYRDTLARAETRFGATHPFSLKLRMNVANAVYKQGRYGQAEALFREVLTTQQQDLGSDHPSTLLTLNNLGNALRRQGRWSAAEDAYREAMSEQRRVLGRGHDETLRTTLNLLRVLEAAERYPAALALIEESLVDQPESVDLWRFKASIEEVAGRLGAAAAAAQQAATLSDGDEEDLLLHARLLAIDGQDEASWAVYRAAIEQSDEPAALAAAALAALTASRRSGQVNESVSARLRAEAGQS